MKKTIVLSINTTWNFINFRSGLLRRLVAEGFEVVAAAPSDAYVEHLRAMGVRFVPIAIDRKGLSPLNDLALLFRYLQLLRKEAPAAFLAWTIKPNIWGSLAAAVEGVPVINNISGLGTAFMTPGALQMIVRTLYRFALRRSSTVFFQNAVDRQLFVASKMVDAQRTALLPGSGIDTAAFAPATRALTPPEAAVTFLMVARLLGDKGVREYVDAARMMRQAGKNARFQLMGAIDPDNRSAVNTRELESWLAEGVIDYLPHCDDVRPAITEADCIVLPSYREGMPRSLLEGAAMAKPLVASDVPGCALIARDRENAFLCRAKDAVSLADAMQRMAALHPSERERMGMAGRRLVEQEFDEAIVIDRYIEALNEAIGRRPRQIDR